MFRVSGLGFRRLYEAVFGFHWVSQRFDLPFGSAAEASRRVNAEPNDKLGPYTFPAIIANLEKL